MKKHPFIFLLLVSFMFQQCSEEDLVTRSNTNSKTQVSFTLDEATSSKIPDGSSVMVSIRSSAGEELYTDHLLALTKTGDVVVSEPLELDANEFELSEFLILKDAEVIYASPKSGSMMAEKVSQSLGLKFRTGETARLNLPVEVAEARNAQADKFGYRSFKKNAKNTFQIIAYFYDNGVKTPLTSYLQIKNADTAYYFYMQDKINTFTFTGDPKATYTLTSYRPGFYREEMPFNLSKLKGKKNQVIEIIMEFTDPADIITLRSTDDIDFTLGMVGVGSLMADFGDGSGQYGEFPSNTHIIYPPDTTYMHFTSGASEGAITVSGDLDQVVSFQARTMYDIDISRLPNLSTFMYTLASEDNLDLSQNSKLRFLRLSYCYIPNIELNSPELSKVYIEGTVIDNIISEVYENTVTHNVRGGSIMIVDEPISEATQQELDNLKNNYGWTINIFNNY